MKSFIANTGILGLIGMGMLLIITVLSVVFNMVFPAMGISGPFSSISLLTSTAGTTSGVAATATAQNISVTVDTDGTVAYGNMAINTTKSTTSGELTGETQTVRNDGNITEKFNILGANTATWTLGAAAGSETYRHEWSDDGASWVWANLTTSYQTMTVSITASATRPLDLRITIPTSTATYTTQTANVTVQAVSP